MRNGRNLPRQATAILLTGLIVFLAAGCRTNPVAVPEAAEVLALLAPPVPEAPEMEPVRFEDLDGGLWLSYDDYRSLERNIIALREYAARLEIVVEFYRGE